MAPRLGIPALLTLLLVAGAGCGSRPGESTSDGAVEVVATTTQVADMVRAVGGDRVAVTQILKPNSDPHDYEPRPSDARAIEGADVVFRSGGEVDQWMDDLIESGGADTRVVDLSESVRLRGDDPHWWQDPRNAVRAAAAIESGLREGGAKVGDAGRLHRAPSSPRPQRGRLHRPPAPIAAQARDLPRRARLLHAPLRA